MEYAAKNNKTDSNTVENSGNIAESKHSLVKEKISGILRSGDQEQAAKQAASEAVSSSSDSSSNSNNKQSIAQRSHIRGILTDASPTTIPNKTRNDIENKYNADFSSVRFYQDAKTTKSVNAKAYTYGSDIVFSPKYYQPNTTEGNKLIAHELAHVVQQNNSGTMQLQRDEVPAAAAKGKQFEFNDSLNEITRRRTVISGGKEVEVSSGLLNHIYVVSILLDTFKDEKKIAILTRAIAANKDAKALSRKYGLAAIMALHDANIDATKAAELLKNRASYYSSDAILKRSKQKPNIIADNLTKVGRDTARNVREGGSYSNVNKDKVKASWDLNLSKENLSTLKQVVPLLSRREASASNGELRIIQGIKDLEIASGKLKKSLKQYTHADNRDLPATKAVITASAALKQLKTAKESFGLASLGGVKGVEDIFDDIDYESIKLSQIIKEWNKYRSVQMEVRYEKRKTFGLDKSNFRKIIKKINSLSVSIYKRRGKLSGIKDSLVRVGIIVRYFISLNDDNYTNSPTLEELAKHLNNLGEIPKDLRKLSSKHIPVGFGLYEQLVVLIKNQIKTRMRMNAKLGEDPGIKPSQDNVKKYFVSLKNGSNQSVVSAYKTYAAGYFQHRVNPAPGWKKEPSVDDIYNHKITIGGTRMQVCAGYAELGMHLFQLAGAKSKGFISWGKYTDAEILANHTNLTSVHLVAKVQRKSQIFYISNHLVYKTAEAAFKDVGYLKEKCIRAKGSTAKNSNDNFVKAFMRRKKVLQNN